MRTIGKALFVCLLFFVGLCFLVAIRDGNKSGGSAASETNGYRLETQSAALAEIAPQVSALKLFIDYQRNEVAADNIYKGHRLTVIGMVTSINKDLFDKVYLSLATPNEFMNVQAHLNEGSESEAAILQRGQVITLVCTGGGMIIGSPMLKDCSFSKLQDAPPAPDLSQPQSPQIAAPPTENVANNAELSATQEGSVEDTMPVKITEGVAAPVILIKPVPKFPDAARQANMGATVLVRLIVDRDGLPDNVSVVRAVYIDREGHASGGPNSIGSNLGFNESAVDCVSKYKFKPAIENGKPVPVEMNITVSFQPPL